MFVIETVIVKIIVVTEMIIETEMTVIEKLPLDQQRESELDAITTKINAIKMENRRW